MKYKCPICGYKGMTEPPQNYNICPCCGTEFGLDDSGATHAELRQRWLDAGAPWFSTCRPQPQDWNPWLQLSAAGYEVP